MITVPRIDPIDYLEEKPKAKRGFRGHAIFFGIWFMLGAGVVCSHVYEWKLPMPGRSYDLPAATQVADFQKTFATDETAAAL